MSSLNSRHGVFLGIDKKYYDLKTLVEVTTWTANMHPFNGVFIDSNGDEFDIRDVLGSGGAISIADEHFFNTVEERDQYFLDKAAELKDGLYIVVAGQMNQYDEATGTWKDVTAVVQGSKGDKGDTGPSGAQGLQGATGATGPTGPTGATGPSGADGTNGVNGTNGTNGKDGKDGAQGIQGPPGEAAISNINYFSGSYEPGITYSRDDSIIASDGNRYVVIVDSIVGVEPPGSGWALLVMKGAPGPQGPAGVDGADGVNGAAGVKGDKGDKGDTGSRGLAGATEYPDLSNPTNLVSVSPASVDLYNATTTFLFNGPMTEDCYLSLSANTWMTGCNEECSLFLGLQVRAQRISFDAERGVDVGEGNIAVGLSMGHPPMRAHAGDWVTVSLWKDGTEPTLTSTSHGGTVDLIQYPVLDAATPYATAFSELEGRVDILETDVAAIDPTTFTKQADFNTHVSTDRFRWQDSYDAQKESIVQAAFALGLKPNNIVTSVGDSYTVTAQAGGIIRAVMQNTVSGFVTVTINGGLVYSSEGLPNGFTVTKYFWVHQNDIIELGPNGASNLYFQNFMDDETSPFHILEQQVAKAEADNQSQQIQINRILSGNVDVILDSTSTIDIETPASSGYTVTNPLGGQIKATAGTYLLVGTGALWVNGGTPVFDNRGVAVGIGSKAFVMDVNANDVITQEALTSLTYTDYVAKT